MSNIYTLKYCQTSTKWYPLQKLSTSGYHEKIAKTQQNTVDCSTEVRFTVSMVTYFRKFDDYTVTTAY